MSRPSGLFNSGDEKKKAGPSERNPSPVIVLQRQGPSGNDALIDEEFRIMGVSLEFLCSLDLPYDASFDDVRVCIMKITIDTKGNRSLYSHLSQNPDHKKFVGKATCFVSYAWKGGFGATMKALRKHFEGKRNVFLWMDIAMVDQHAAANTNVDFSDWSSTFGGSLKEIGRAVIVLTPAQKPIAITRSWCCFEWASIKQAGIPFDYCVTPEDVEGLIDFMERGMGFADFNDLFAAINMEKATAFKKSDEEAILKLVREIGVKEVNDIIMFSLKDWLLRVATEAEKRVKDGTKEGVFLLNAKASLHKALGEYDEALSLFEQASASARRVPDDDIGVATQLNNLALLLRDTNRKKEARELGREAYKIALRALGDGHPDTTNYKYWLTF